MYNNISSKQDTTFHIMSKCFISVIIIYLVFTPVFYIFNLLAELNFSFLIYLIGHALQFCSIIALGILYRKKNTVILSENKKRPIIFMCFFFLSIISILLFLFEVPQDMYRILMASLNVYEIIGNNLFVSVLLDQLFNSYIILAFFVCSMIIFFTPKLES